MPLSLIDAHEPRMARSDRIAAAVRRRLETSQTPAFNLISSPGAGKTLLLERTLEALNTEMEIAVVVADCDDRHDAKRIARYTGSLVQSVRTDGASHLDARQVERALAFIDLDFTDLLLIENVGNLICPACWDLGEDAKIVLFSVTEGEDKPLKYRNAFRNADYVVFTKLDLLPHLDFHLPRAVGYLMDVNPQLEIFHTSARTGEGLDEWFSFLRRRVRR